MSVDNLENLLNLHGEVFPMDSGYWIKFEAHQVNPSVSIPHGIKYSLTLHDKNNQRVIGMTMLIVLSHLKSTELEKSPMTISTNRWI